METQKDIDKYLLAHAKEDPMMDDFLFHKLYKRLGNSEEENILRDLIEYSFDFSNKKNACVALNLGENLPCGEPCEDFYCHKHVLQIKALSLLPRPCIGCGVGAINEYCKTCTQQLAE